MEKTQTYIAAERCMKFCLIYMKRHARVEEVPYGQGQYYERYSDHSQLFYTLLNLGMFEEASEMRRVADEKFLYEAVYYADFCLALLKYEQVKLVNNFLFLNLIPDG